MPGWLRGAIDEALALMAPTRRLRLALVLAALRDVQAAGRPLRVLDAGCGDGLLTMAIARQHPDWQLTGWDVLDDLLEGARQRAAGRGLTNIAFEHVDLLEALPEVSFDVILAVECLTEIPDDRGTLERLSGRLAPGGWLVVHVPETGWRPILPGSSPIWREEVRHGYTAQDMTELFGELGLTDVRATPTLRGTVTLAQEVRDRLKDTPVWVRLALLPVMLAAVGLERAGLTWGEHRALLIHGRRFQSRS